MPRERIRHSRRGGAERAHMRLRRTLLDMVHDICTRDSLTAWDLARICGTSRPRACTLLARRIELFNSETLVDILWRLGVDLELRVTKRSPYLRYVIANPRPGWKPPPDARR